MSDIPPGLIIFGTLIAQEQASRILGPTSDYLGQGLKEWAKRRVDNVRRIFDKAATKLGDKIEEEGAVPPKVLKQVLDDGSFCEDELVAEYFGGVLASSRSGIPRDDRGAYVLNIVSRLSTYQLRAHFLFYYAIKQAFDGEYLSPALTDGRRKMRLFMPTATFHTGMDFTKDENINTFIGHIMMGLAEEGLIDQPWAFGSVDNLRLQWKQAIEPGILLTPSALGVELFLWSQGKGEITPAAFLTPQVQFALPEGINLPSGFQATEEIDTT